MDHMNHFNVGDDSITLYNLLFGLGQRKSDSGSASVNKEEHPDDVGCCDSRASVRYRGLLIMINSCLIRPYFLLASNLSLKSVL